MFSDSHHSMIMYEKTIRKLYLKEKKLFFFDSRKYFFSNDQFINL